MATAFAGTWTRFFAMRDPAADPARLRPGIDAWCDDLRAGVAPKVAAQLQWDEASTAWLTEALGDSGWLALRLLAFHADRPELEWPDTVPALLELVPEWRAAADAKFERSHYGQLLACDAWLPGDFPVTLKAPLPDGTIAEIGSLDVLADQLAWLNQRTFDAGPQEVASWTALPAPPGGEFVDAARRGYAGLAAAVAFAQRHRVPLLVRP
jgi:hypothetical protein